MDVINEEVAPSSTKVVRQVWVAIITSSLHITCGINLAYSAILLPQLLAEQNSTSGSQITFTAKEMSWITSSVAFTVPISTITAGIAMDTIGRLNALKLSVIPNVIGCVLVATATNSTMIIIGRFVTGLSIAWASHPCTVYISEVSRPDIRGALLSVGPVFFSVGMVLTFLKGWLVDWRMVAWLTCIYAIIPIPLIMTLHESPSWFISKGLVNKAKRSIEWFNKTQESSNTSSAELKTLIDQNNLKEALSWKTKLGMFLKPTIYKPLIILIVLFALQQYSGVHIVILNGVLFFRDMGITYDAYLSLVLVGVIRLTMTGINVWLMKKFNRRTLLMLSTMGMTISVGIAGFFIKLQHQETSWVPVVMVMLYFVFVCVGMLNMPYIIPGEVFPLALRGVSFSISVSISFMLMFVALHTYEDLLIGIGGAANLLYFFALMSLVAFLFTFVFLPETQGVRLSDIENYFSRHTTYLRSKVVTTERTNNLI